MSVGGTTNPTVWQRLFVLTGLSAAAFSAPVLDIYGRNPEVFVANRTSAAEIVLFGLIVALFVPLVSLLALYLAGLVGERAQSITYGVLVFLLALGTGLVVSRQVFPESGLAAIAMAGVVTLVILFLVGRFWSVLVWFGLAVPAVLVIFLTASPSSSLVWRGPEASSAAFEIENPAPLVFVQLDEFPAASLMTRDGEVNEVLFPTFARLAEEGTWYRNTMSNSIATTQSVPAILTGKLGEKGLSPSSVDHPDNLFTMLGGAYEMHVIEWVADLCPEDICPEYAGRSPARFSSLLADVGVVYGHLSLPPFLREGLPSIDNAWKGFLGQSDRPTGTQVEIEGLPVPDDSSRVKWADWFQRIANGIDGGGTPILSYLHVQSPHVPWETNPSGTHYDRPEEYTEVEGVEGDGHWGPDVAPTLLGYQRHLFQLGFLDTMIGRVVEQLDETGTYDETMIVVVADHGASFEPGEHRRWPKENNRVDLYRIPLFVKYPNQDSGATVDAPAYGIDILPTIVDAMGVDTNWAFDGQSLLTIEGTDRPQDVIWWCCNGDPINTNLANLYGQVDAAFERVPDQSSWAAVAGAGPYADLVGRPLASVDVAESEELRWSMTRGSDLVDASVESGHLQTLWTGRIELPQGSDAHDVLLAVNGDIAGVGYITRDSADGGSFRGLISEEAVANGRNELDVLIPDGQGGFLSGAADVIRLELKTSDGRVLNIREEGAKRVQVDDVSRSPIGYEVRGWGADVSAKTTPDMIYAFAGEELVAEGEPNRENQNVVGWFDSEDLLMSGFLFEIVGSDIPDGVDQLTVVAEFGDYAVADPARLPSG